MKLFRFTTNGSSKLGLYQNEKYWDVSAFGGEYDEHFFETGKLNDLAIWFLENKSTCTELQESFVFLAPVSRPSKLVCVGLNYVKHALEFNKPIPTEPVLFFKSTTAICGAFDKIELPKNAVKTDWEVELAIVIGKKAKNIPVESAYDYIAGYTLMNDVSERGFQTEREGQWCKGKSADTFAPIGPFLVTKDEVSDPNNLQVWLKVNGETKQFANTSDFIFDVPTVVSYISHFMTLLPGDVISTGTPAGIGMGLQPPQYLKDGDVVDLGIEKIGTAQQICKQL